MNHIKESSSWLQIIQEKIDCRKMQSMEIQEFIHLLRQKCIPLELIDRHGNNFLSFLFHEFYCKRNNEINFLNFYKTDVPLIIDLFKNKNFFNEDGENFFWFLSQNSFTDLEPEKLNYYIDKYNIDINKPNIYQESLLDKAISQQCELLMDFYLQKNAKFGADPFKAFSNYSFHNGTSFTSTPVASYFFSLIKQRVFHQLISQHRLFNCNNKTQLAQIWLSKLNNKHSQTKAIENCSVIVNSLFSKDCLIAPQDYPHIISFLQTYKNYLQEVSYTNSIIDKYIQKTKITEQIIEVEKQLLSLIIAPTQNTNKTITKI